MGQGRTLPHRGSAFTSLDQTADEGDSAQGQRDSKQEHHQHGVIHESVHCVAHHADETGGEITSSTHDTSNTSSSICEKASFPKNLWMREYGFEPMSPDHKTGILPLDDPAILTLYYNLAEAAGARIFELCYKLLDTWGRVQYNTERTNATK